MITRQIMDFSEIEMLYNTKLRKDFSPDELKPLDSMRRSWIKNEYACFGLFENEKNVGYAFYLCRKGNFLLDYLAIDREYQRKGLGSLFLRQLAEYTEEAECVICEVENPDTAENEEQRKVREQRMQFYLRNGYRKTELTAVVFGVNYRILELPMMKEHSLKELRRIYTEIYHSSLPEEIFKKEFRMAPVRKRIPNTLEGQ